MRKKELRFGIRSSILILTCCIILVHSGCSRQNGRKGPYSIGDEELVPFALMHQIDRSKLCLAEISSSSNVFVSKSDSINRGYDIALNMSGPEVSKSVYFVWENDHYVWIGEQETHYSGRKYSNLDGTFQEHITITYFERGTQGAPKGLRITYWGNDDIPSDMTCNTALSYIKEWDTRKLE